ncbi:sulfite exporter TauE/SafE family protein [Ferrovibrio sp.]|uniref:sulfite exporter TauE/SafE family protein n=1 Tax=Ferrovibrio sp. TaxID=1917215 RepID=UPI0025BD2F57|nr:sulfite exporter TauE/SafE family protein [Ferrovibrio sp.]MBX3454637.1 sulfite exporter TauE/SafE family protein [Ferrovibrio sp.]
MLVLEQLQAAGLASPAPLAGTALAFLAAAILRGFTGFGFALVAVPFSSLALPPSRSVPVVFILQLMIGAIDTMRHHRNLDRRFITIAAFAVITTPLGVYLLSIAQPSMARIAIATIVLAGATMMWRPFRLPMQPSQKLAACTGISVGLCNGMAAMPGPPAIAYSMLTHMPADKARSSLMILFFTTALAGVPSTLAFGIADSITLLLAMAALPIIMLGSALGAMLFRRYGTKIYREAALFTLIGTALAMMIREVWPLISPS